MIQSDFLSEDDRKSLTALARDGTSPCRATQNAWHDAIERKGHFGCSADYTRYDKSLSKESSPPMVYDESVGLVPTMSGLEREWVSK